MRQCKCDWHLVCLWRQGLVVWSLLPDMLHRFLLQLTGISLFRKKYFKFLALKTLRSYHNIAQIFYVQQKFDY